MCRTVSLALALASLAPIAAVAQDYGNGGIKDYRNGVPVPAPVPVYEHFRWYLRADVGGGFTNKPSVRENGLRFGAVPWTPLDPPYFATDPAWTSTTAPFGMASTGFTRDFDTLLMGGLGVGLYLTPRLRGDITVDKHTKSEIGYHGSHQYVLQGYGATQAPPPVPNPPYSIRGTTTEHSNIHTTTALANLYWDLTDRGGFTPYIGVGAGFAVREVERRHQTDEQMHDASNQAVAPTASTPTSRTYTANTKSNNIVAAVALTAGASYSVTQGMLVDFSYRYSWLGSADASMKIGGDYSKLSIGDAHEHTLRAGLRWNVW